MSQYFDGFATDLEARIFYILIGVVIGALLTGSLIIYLVIKY